jgi:hypothetical protein
MPTTETPPTAMMIAQEMRDRLSLQVMPDALVAERLEQQSDGSVAYTVATTDESALSAATRQIGLLLRGQYPDAKIDALGEADPDQPGQYRVTLTVAQPAATKTAKTRHAAVEVLAVALQVGEHLYGIAPGPHGFVVLRDGDETETSDSPAEAFGQLFGLARQDLWGALHPTVPLTDEICLDFDHDFIAGILPALLASPAVQGRAADELLKFFEIATLQIAPGPEELPEPLAP